MEMIKKIQSARKFISHQSKVKEIKEAKEEFEQRKKTKVQEKK
jgi:hypothetical protein